MAILDTFFCITCAFYSQYNTVWIANTEIGLNSNSSIIKRLWCMSKLMYRYIAISKNFILAFLNTSYIVIHAYVLHVTLMLHRYRVAAFHILF